MTALNDNRLHADPGNQAGAPTGKPLATETAEQRNCAVTIFEKSREGRRAFVAPDLDVPHDADALPERFRRREPPRLPEIAEPEIVRHYNRLSKRNFDPSTRASTRSDSCTMKHNPKPHERVRQHCPQRAPCTRCSSRSRAQGALR
jgi:glycine dehydrogenase subunit 2